MLNIKQQKIFTQGHKIIATMQHKYLTINKQQFNTLHITVKKHIKKFKQLHCIILTF